MYIGCIFLNLAHGIYMVGNGVTTNQGCTTFVQISGILTSLELLSTQIVTLNHMHWQISRVTQFKVPGL
jgi:hypothetical protein